MESENWESVNHIFLPSFKKLEWEAPRNADTSESSVVEDSNKLRSPQVPRKICIQFLNSS